MRSTHFRQIWIAVPELPSWCPSPPAGWHSIAVVDYNHIGLGQVGSIGAAGSVAAHAIDSGQSVADHRA